MRFTIRQMNAADWEMAAQIYAAGIATRNATFEAAPPSWESWDAAHHPTLRLVAVEDSGNILGWAALSPVSGRCVYAGVMENSIYIAPEARGQGIGRALLTALIDASEDAEVWTIQTGIFPENEGSVALHEACGFRRLGVRQKIGQMDGVWRDVLFMERRSQRVGWAE